MERNQNRKKGEKRAEEVTILEIRVAPKLKVSLSLRSPKQAVPPSPLNLQQVKNRC